MPDLLIQPGERGTGYRRDSDQQRSYDLALGRVFRPSFSASTEPIDLRTKFRPPVRDQGKSNFCVRFAGCALMEYVEVVVHGKPWAPFSPLFAAWQDCYPEDRGTNSGTQIYKFADAAAQYGVCSEDEVPWELTPGDYLQRLKVRPPQPSYAEAERHQITASQRLPDHDLSSLNGTLERGFPICVGLPVRRGWWTSMNAGGVLNNVGTIDGYHALVVVGRIPLNGRWYYPMRNSWGLSGDGGYVYMPEDQMVEFTDGRVVATLEMLS